MYCTIHCIIAIIIGASSNSIIRYVGTINVTRKLFITQLNSYNILRSTLKALCKADILFTNLCIIVIGTKDADLCRKEPEYKTFDLPQATFFVCRACCL